MQSEQQNMNMWEMLLLLPREGHHVHCQLPKISIQLSWEPQAGGHARHGGRDQVVQVPIGGGVQLQGAETYIIESLVIYDVSFICVLY